MITLHAKNEKPVMQGNTSLKDSETILYAGKKSLSNVCKCGQPFVTSLMQYGIILDTVNCSHCKAEQAHIVPIED